MEQQCGKAEAEGKKIALQKKKEAADERHGNTFNKWSQEELSEF